MRAGAGKRHESAFAGSGSFLLPVSTEVIARMATGIYADKRWPPLRARILRRDDYLCQQCLRYGKHRAATTVHHCFPAGRYPGYAWAAWNLVSLCSRCHDAMHDRNSEQLTPLGEQWRRRADQRKPPHLRP